MPLKISISGIRGTVPDSLTPEICLNFAKAFGTYLQGKKVVVGTDSRSSSEYLKGIVFSGLLSCGCDVVDLGICPTPTVGLMARALKAQGGVVITASHNPLPWNGLKFMREDGIFLSESQAKKLIKIYESKNFLLAQPGKVSFFPTALDFHLHRILKAVNPSLIRSRKFKVAVDASNGAGSYALPKLIEKLGGKVYPINCNPKLPFPHPPEPIPENIVDLQSLVREKKADLGFALDSDADRLAIISEEGRPIGEELTLALCLDFVLRKYPYLSPKKKIVVTNLSSSQVLNDIAKAHGAPLIRTKIGEVHVAEELKSLKGIIGGEGNGGVIYPKVGYNRDSLTAAALILNYLASSRKTISELVTQFPSYHMIKTKIECHSYDQAQELIEKVKRAFRGKDLILTEGVKVVLPEAWVHVRASNTEPIVRIIAEAKETAQAQKLIDQVFEALR
jgi:phosphomannomutase